MRSDLQPMSLNGERPLWEIRGLAIPAGTPWEQLRIGELETLLALVVDDEEAIREGCDWLHHFRDLAPARRPVCRCINSMLNMRLIVDDNACGQPRSVKSGSNSRNGRIGLQRIAPVNPGTARSIGIFRTASGSRVTAWVARLRTMQVLTLGLRLITNLFALCFRKIVLLITLTASTGS